MLTVAYEHLEPLDVSQTVDRLATTFSTRCRRPRGSGPEHIDDDIARYLNDAIRGIVAAGIVVREHAVDQPKPGGWTAVTAGGTLTLTPYGVATVQRLAPLWNVDAPVLTRFSVETGGDPIALYRALDEQLAGAARARCLRSSTRSGPSGGCSSSRVGGPTIRRCCPCSTRSAATTPTAAPPRRPARPHCVTAAGSPIRNAEPAARYPAAQVIAASVSATSKILISPGIIQRNAPTEWRTQSLPVTTAQRFHLVR